MAGETLRCEAICLDIRPWSRTSHIVTWLTPTGKLATIVKGAVRPKSFFLGQYDLNYTCEILYYARAKGEVHALRECTPLEPREALRSDYRALMVAGYLRAVVSELAPRGPECTDYLALLTNSLDELMRDSSPLSCLTIMRTFELECLKFAGLSPDFSLPPEARDEMGFGLFSIARGTFVRLGNEGSERCLRLSPDTIRCLCAPARIEKNIQVALDTERVIGVYYNFHLDCVFDVRRAVLGLISSTKQES